MCMLLWLILPEFVLVVDLECYIQQHALNLCYACLGDCRF